MIYNSSSTAVIVFIFFVGVVLALSFYLGRRAKSAKGYYAAHGQINWFVNGVAFAGDYLSAASFLGICGLIAFYGYDGFLYSIGYLAGWVVALFVIAEPLKRLGRFTFADALDAGFNSRGIKLSAAISTLVVSIFYLIPQMVGAGTLIKPLLGFSYAEGVIMVGIIVIIIVVTAGMVSTTWVQFIKGSLLVIFCIILTGAILNRGLVKGPSALMLAQPLPADAGPPLPETGGWVGKPYVRIKSASGAIIAYRKGTGAPVGYSLTQTLTKTPDGKMLVNGLPQTDINDLIPVGHVASLADPSANQTGSLGPIEFISQFSRSTIVTWSSEVIKDASGTNTVYYPTLRKGSQILLPGGSSTFKGVRTGKLMDRLDFISLMLALFAGTASLPHILIRYYTVKDEASARKSTIVGIAAIGFFYILTLFLGLGAMTSGTLDVTNNNMAAPLLAKSFGNLPFALISAIAFTTVLGTVSGLIMASSGAVAHDLMTNFLGMDLNDHQKVKAGKIAAVVVGIIAMVLGILFQELNVAFLVGWAFNVAASANLPSLVMLLFWKRTTKLGITAAITVGLITSVGWLMLSAPAYSLVYKLDPARAIAPFSQPALVTLPLGFIVLIVVSLLSKQRDANPSVIGASR